MYFAWEGQISAEETVMEPSKIHGDTEEHSSNESGWTMYIASPIHEKNTFDDDGYHNNERKGYKDVHGEDGESDDSMASDASSVPSNQERPCGSYEASHGSRDIKHAKAKENKKGSGKTGYRKAERKLHAEKIKATKAEAGQKGKSASDDACSRGKFRKYK